MKIASYSNDIVQCIANMERGNTILYPTDTVWGLGCDAMNKEAIDKILTIKKRPKNKSFIILLAEAKDILQYVATPPPDIISIIEGFLKPTTVIFENALGFPDNLTHTDGSIAIRIVNDPFCKTLIKQYRKPIVSTSANISGEPTPAIFREINKAVVAAADYVVTYRRDDEKLANPSSIIKIFDDGTQQVIRP